jgi:hypothetical protein
MPTEFTDEELKEIRSLLVANKRRLWLLAGIRSISIWVVGVLAAWGAVKAGLAELLK